MACWGLSFRALIIRFGSFMPRRCGWLLRIDPSSRYFPTAACPRVTYRIGDIVTPRFTSYTTCIQLLSAAFCILMIAFTIRKVTFSESQYVRLLIPVSFIKVRLISTEQTLRIPVASVCPQKVVQCTLECRSFYFIAVQGYRPG